MPNQKQFEIGISALFPGKILHALGKWRLNTGVLLGNRAIASSCPYTAY